jgi:hypothetical protein
MTINGTKTKNHEIHEGREGAATSPAGKTDWKLFHGSNTWEQRWRQVEHHSHDIFKTVSAAI